VIAMVPGPVQPQQRNLAGLDYLLLWAGAAISLSEIWAGGLLAPLGLAAGVLAILLGHLIGCTPMALGGVIGSRHGVPSMVSTRGALGNNGSHLPAILNMVQLMGWTAVMLWIGGQTAVHLAPAGSPITATGWIAITGILTTFWSLIDARYWKTMQRIGVFLLLLLSVVMTAMVFRHHDVRSLLAAKPAGGMPFMSGLDLVIAMPISWLPLAADYARFAKSGRSSFWGTWVGYLVASSWMYIVGLAAAIATQTDKPDEMVMGLMSSLGLALPALVIVMLSTFTTTFLDVYSNAVSAVSLFPRLRERPVIILSGLAGTVLAMYFPAAEYETFLLFIGAMFCPLFGVVLTDYFAIKRGQYEAADLYARGRYWYNGGINIRAMIAWAIGFAVYQAITLSGAGIGASLPGMLMSGMVYYLFMSKTTQEPSSWPEALASPVPD